MIEYIHEPTDLQCGQAVLAMVLGKTVDEIVTFLQNDRETTLAEMKRRYRKRSNCLRFACSALKRHVAGTGRCTQTAHSTTPNTVL